MQKGICNLSPSASPSDRIPEAVPVWGPSLGKRRPESPDVAFPTLEGGWGGAQGWGCWPWGSVGPWFPVFSLTLSLPPSPGPSGWELAEPLSDGTG